MWKPLQHEAPAFFRFLHNFGFTYDEYVSLLETYNAGPAGDFDQVGIAINHNRQTMSF